MSNTGSFVEFFNLYEELKAILIRISLPFANENGSVRDLWVSHILCCVFLPEMICLISQKIKYLNT